VAEPSSVDRQAEHLDRLLRALVHTHTFNCYCRPDFTQPTHPCGDCGGDAFRVCPERCEHEKTAQNLTTTPTGESA
jgi:hypothetical protein